MCTRIKTPIRDFVQIYCQRMCQRYQPEKPTQPTPNTQAPAVVLVMNHLRVVSDRVSFHLFERMAANSYTSPSTSMLAQTASAVVTSRSEERRVGKEWRSRWWAWQ